MIPVDFRAMGCQMRLIAEAGPANGEELLARVPEWFAEWERVLSRFRPDSELSRLNQTSGEWVRVGPVLWDVLQAARRASRRTHGLVTPCVLPALEAVGYDRTFERIRQSGSAPAIETSPVPDMSEIRFNTREHSVFFSEGTRLDLAGTAKGWAADLVVLRLASFGRVLMDAGGDIAVRGIWPVGVADPKDPNRDLAILKIPYGGVATSGRDYRHWTLGGITRHHILDPRTGLPAETDVLTATVVASSAVVAEAAAKAALILGCEAGLQWLERRPSLAGLIVLEDGQVVLSQRMASFLWE